MAVQAIFQADFSNFESGVKDAEAGLTKLQTTGKSTEVVLQRMTSAATAGTGPAQQIGTAYRQFDGILASAGINIGPFVKGLEDIAGAASGAASAMGLLGEAGLIVAAAIAAWQTAKAVSEVTGLTAAVNDTIQANYDWIAQQEIIDTAIEMGGTHIRKYGEAVDYINQQLGKAMLPNFRQQLVEAEQAVRALTEAQIREFQIDKEGGATVEQLTLKYGLSARAQEVLANQLKVTADQHNAAAAAAKKHAEETARLAEAEAKVIRELQLAAVAKAMQDEIDKQQLADKQHVVNQLQEAYGNLAKKQAEQKAEEQRQKTEAEQLEAEYQETVKAGIAYVEKLHDAHLDAGAAGVAATQATAAGYGMVAQQAQLTMDSARALAFVLRETAQANAILMENSLFTTSGQLERIANLPLPKGFGNSSTVNNTFNLTDTESQLARRVSEEIMRTVKSGTQLATT